jgi:hypothetical protein
MQNANARMPQYRVARGLARRAIVLSDPAVTIGTQTLHSGIAEDG